ncbi:hypothetical protein BDN67DRAFT_886630, partial [Paxillus ammoniavirescens]
VPLHTIPNFVFGKVSMRAIVRVFLPHMYGRESRGVPSPDLALIYDSCLHPLAREMLLNMSTHWPASYDSALVLYRDNKGCIHLKSLNIPHHRLKELGRKYLERLARLRPYFRDAYFIHKLHGWKGATTHNSEHLPDKVGVLADLTQVLDMTRVVEEEWQVDMALEVGHPGQVVTWKTSGHRALLASCLPSLRDGEAERIMQGSRFTL